MDGNKLARQRVCTSLCVILFAVALILQLDPVSPVFASQFNETLSNSPDLGTGGLSSCDPQDPACLGSGGGSSDDNPGDIGAPPPCDPQDPACSDTGAPPPCDPQDPSCGVSPCDPQDPACSDTGAPPPCDPQDPACSDTGAPPPCDPQDPSCGVSPCDPQDPNCNPDCDPQDPNCGGSGSPTEICGDDIDNDGNGKVDDIGICGGGPPLSSFPGGAASTPSDLNDGTFSPVSEVGPPTILASALQTNLLPVPTEASLPREDLCNDGLDNDHNGPKDSEDPDCALSEITQTELNSSQVSIISKAFGNISQDKTLVETGAKGIDQLTENSNTIIVLIFGADKHDIRTVSLHYKYSPEQVTVEKGSRVIWINQDTTDSHGINLIEKISGKVIFSNPLIRYGTATYYDFEQAGVFIYSDPVFPSMTGQITVLN